MSCLDNTDILRIVGGNSFQISITVKARRVADGSEIEDFDLSASSPVLNLIHAGEKTQKYFVTQGNQAIISFDGSEGLGYYGMEMSGSYNSEAWRFCIEKVLQLVDTNAKANIPEWSVLVDDTYFIEGTISIYGGGGGGDTVQSDWTETNPTSAAFILHKPDLSVYATKTEVASGLAGKQDTIVDLSSIRYGAAAGATAYQKPVTGIPESDMSEGVQSALEKAEDAYQLPANGIPASDMDSEVQASLEKANSAVQTESDPIFSGSPAADITQADINGWNAKQPAIADLSAIREGAAAGATAVQPDEMAQAIDEVDGDIADINAKIPSAASNLNQLADKAYVNSSIATNSATYRGSFNLITDLGMNVDATHAQIAGALATAIVTADNNDYAFVQIPDSASTPTVIAKIERYKHNGSGWVYEYDLNNSGFTAAQWAAINSGVTSGLVGKLSDLPNSNELATLLNGKQNTINDLSAIRSGASAGATAIQPADLTDALNGVEAEIAGLDESKQDTIEDLSTIRSGAAAGATAYQKPVTGIPESDMSDGVQTSLGKADSAYQKPSSGIPSTDMSEGVQEALAKANSAVQTETDPVFSNSPAAEITQADINTWNAKQSAIGDLADIREGAAAGATAVQPDEMAQAIDEVDGDIADINAKIPSTASSLNQLADKAYVNSSIATNSATYRGSFNLITDLGMNVDATHAQIAGALATAIVTADNNDYAFVQIPDSASTPTVIAKIERYKHNGTGWVYEYDLNNSGFTAAQWAAINSGITSGLVGKLADLPNNSELATLLNGKQNTISDLATIRSGASAGATAVQPADLTEALNGVEDEIAGLDESKQDVIEDLSTIRSGAAAGATAYQKPASGIPESDMSGGVQTSLGKADSAYQKPVSGIPASDMSEGVQEALAKANSAVQTETDPVFSNSPAAEISQTDINNWNAKQSAIADLADIREGAAAGASAVQPDEMAQAIDEVDGDIDAINAKIPSTASNLNQLADKAYVNSSIATNSATYRGSFNLITDLGMNVDATHAQIAGALATAITTADNNDYAFVQIPDSASTPTVIAKIERYKHNGSGWVYEYDLNNSGFTAAQWAAINSGITSGLVGKLSDLPNNGELATLLNGKQNVISDLAAIRSGAAAGATAYQKPSGGIPASDMSSTVQQELSKANTAVQTETDPIFSASPASGITAQNIQTWNGEPAARQAADASLQTAIQDEATARATADALLQQQYNALTQSDIIVGALPASGVANVIYRVPGTTDFTDYMWYDNQFVPMATYGLPISAEFVVDNNLNKTQEEVNEFAAGVFDISVSNAVGGTPTAYVDLAAALGTNGANIPQGFRKGGMSVRFIQSSDNKYVQYLLTKETWSTTPSDWINVVRNLNKLEDEFDELNEALDVYRTAPTWDELIGTAVHGYVALSNGQVSTTASYDGLLFLVSKGDIVNIKCTVTNILATIALAAFVEEFKSSASAIVIRNLAPAGSVDLNYTVPYDGYIFVQTAYSSGSVSTVSGLSVTKRVNGNFITDFRTTYDKSAFTVKGYLVKYGNVILNDSYRCTNFIPIMRVGVVLTKVVSSPNFQTIVFYDKNKNVVGYIGNQGTDFVINASDIPWNCVYIRVGATAQGVEQAKIVIEPQTLEMIRRIGSINYTRHGQNVEKDTFSNNETISLDTPIIRENRTISFYGKITSFEKITIQSGTVAFARCKMAVDNTNIYVYSHISNDFDTPISTYPHGLNISTFINVIIKVGRAGNAVVYLSTLGGEKVQNIDNWSTCYNTTTVKNTNSVMSNCALTFSCVDYWKNVWLVGDSFMSYWVPLAQEKGFGNFLQCGRPGTATDEALQSLQYCLNYATPKVIVWAIGMNNADSGAINTTWKTGTESVMDLCTQNGIELILVTIPNTPTKDNSYKNSYIKSSGYRYVDICEAVGADISTSWYTGLLGYDPHPSTEGSLVIANRYISDIPEFRDN